jgi:hypothetical protein
VVSNDRLNRYDNGFGSGYSLNESDLSLLGRVWICYAVHAHESVGPQRRLAGPHRPHVRGETGWAAPWIRAKCRIQLRNSFLFQIYFVNYKSI